MRRPREAVDAAVFAPAVRVNTGFETDIGALIARDNRFRRIPVIFGRSWFFFVVTVRLNDIDVAEIEVKLFESIGRAPRCAAAVNGG